MDFGLNWRGVGGEAWMVLRPDYRKIASIYGDARTGERITAHYALERRLADEMRSSSKADRESGLYNRLYDVLLRDLPDHPRHRAESPASLARQREYTLRQTRLILEEVGKDDVFLEMGG